MSLLANLVFQRSVSTGVSPMILTAVTGYNTFILQFPNNDETDLFYYTIRHKSLNEWEIGVGYLDEFGHLVRETVYWSSNANNRVEFSPGSKDVSNDIPANYLEKLFTLDASLAGKAALVHTHVMADITDLAAAMSNKASLDVTNTFTKQQKIPFGTLTDQAVIAWDMNLIVSAFVTLAGNRTLANPTNVAPGQGYVALIKQDNVGNRTLALGSMFRTPGGAGITLSTAANAIDRLYMIASDDGLFIDVTIQKAFA